MPLPAVQLKPFASGPEPTEIVVGVTEGAEDLFPVVPLVEPIADSEPPVPPVLVRDLTLDAAEVVRRVGAASGHVVTSAIAAGCGPRPRFSMEWPSLSQAERDSVLVWLRESVRVGGAGGSLYAINLRIDGPVDETVKVRIVTAPEAIESLVERVAGTDGLYRIGPLECEEVY